VWTVGAACLWVAHVTMRMTPMATAAPSANPVIQEGERRDDRRLAMGPVLRPYGAADC
jgi:hypothetical protein